MTEFGTPHGGEPTAGDRYVTWDAAYVLGSLSSADRLEYETHLQGCARCRSAVSELSGMPALLGKLDAEDIQSLDEAQPEPPPLRPEVLKSVLDRVRWRRRRTRWLTSAAVGVAAALLAVGLVVAIRPEVVGLHNRPAVETAQALEMTKLAPSPFSATVSMSEFAWGTRIDMACTYGQWSGAGNAPPSNLGMVVVGRDGSRTQVATWLGITGATALPSGNTPLPAREIVAVQLVSAEDGQVLLERNL